MTLLRITHTLLGETILMVLNFREEEQESTEQALSAGEAISHYLDNEEIDPNVCTYLAIVFDTPSLLSQSLSHVEYLPVVTTSLLPNLERIVLFVPSRLPIDLSRKALPLLRAALLPLLHDKSRVEIVQGLDSSARFDTTRMWVNADEKEGAFMIVGLGFMGNDGDDGTEDFTDAAVQEALQYYETVSKVTILTHCSKETFGLICALPALEDLRLCKINIPPSWIAEVVACANAKDKRDGAGLSLLRYLWLQGVTLETYHDFESLCGAVGESKLHLFHVTKPTILDSAGSTFSPIFNILQCNPHLMILDCAENTRFVPSNDRLTVAQQQDEVYETLKLTNHKVCSFNFDDSWSVLPNKISERLDLNFYGLGAFTDPCNYAVGNDNWFLELLQVAKAREQCFVKGGGADKPCLLSALFVLFRARPTLIAFPPGSTGIN
ncbi:expressed unknown protein [Seminavis robusta]|uniref:Uncharacterized protein n=1 Tax=Seminavis robusta TaxID=568900 RepID=A0A9N8EJJ7_9STRA|nr:expressed unknown protein [Seminavis robusta]|eukprot:Sro1060_g236700.1 n/a (437) ;mRNA; r:24134-25444